MPSDNSEARYAQRGRPRLGANGAANFADVRPTPASLGSPTEILLEAAHRHVEMKGLVEDFNHPSRCACIVGVLMLRQARLARGEPPDEP